MVFFRSVHWPAANQMPRGGLFKGRTLGAVGPDETFPPLRALVRSANPRAQHVHPSYCKSSPTVLASRSPVWAFCLSVSA